MRGYAAIGLHNPKTEANIVGVMRAAHCYGAKLVNVAGERYKRQVTDTTKAWRHTPVLNVTNVLDAIPLDCVPVVIEINDIASSLFDYEHPERAYYIFGPEDGSVPAHVVERARDVVYVPTSYCMNLAATVNVVLYDRAMKQARNT